MTLVYVKCRGKNVLRKGKKNSFPPSLSMRNRQASRKQRKNREVCACGICRSSFAYIGTPGVGCTSLGRYSMCLPYHDGTGAENATKATRR